MGGGYTIHGGTGDNDGTADRRVISKAADQGLSENPGVVVMTHTHYSWFICLQQPLPPQQPSMNKGGGVWLNGLMRWINLEDALTGV